MAAEAKQHGSNKNAPAGPGAFFSVIQALLADQDEHRRPQFAANCSQADRHG
jgi:hypothetical protein